MEKGNKQKAEKKEGGGPEGCGESWGVKKDKKEGTGRSGKVKYIDRTCLSYSP